MAGGAVAPDELAHFVDVEVGEKSCLQESWFQEDAEGRDAFIFVTIAGKLPAQYVIHAVGPTWQGGEKQEPELLRKTYLACLQLARSLNVESISFPNISTGTYRFPKPLAAAIALEAVRSFQSEAGTLKTINFICFEEESYEKYRELLGGQVPEVRE